MTKYPENVTVWISRVINGFREVSYVKPEKWWYKDYENYTLGTSPRILEKIPGDLSKTEVIKLLEIRGVNPRRIRFKRRCKNLEKVFMGNELSGATSV